MEKAKRIYKKIDVSCNTCLGVSQVTKSNLKLSLEKQGFYNCRKCAMQIRDSKYTNFKGTPIHNSYQGARQRCNYPKHSHYHNYGGRGIKMLWENFSEFYEDMKDTWFEGATLDRVDVNGNYCKENCKWVTMSEQCQNMRKNIHTKEQITEIRRLYTEGGISCNKLALLYNDSRGNIHNIISRRTWNF